MMRNLLLKLQNAITLPNHCQPIFPLKTAPEPAYTWTIGQTPPKGSRAFMAKDQTPENQELSNITHASIHH